MNTGSVFASDVLPIGAAWTRHAVGPLQPHQHQQYRSAESRRRTRIARRRSRLQPLESRRGCDVQSVARGQPVCGLQRGQPGAHVDRTGLRRSQPAVQAAERAGRRSAAESGRHQDVRSGRARGRRARHLERRVLPRRQPRRHAVRGLDADRIRLLQEFRQHAAAGDRARRERAQGPRHAAAPATPGSTRPSRARKPSTARATARTTPPWQAARGWKARSTSRPGDRIPLIPRQMFKAFADIQVTAEAVGGSRSHRRVRRLRARQREQREPAGRHLLSRSRHDAGYGIRQSRRALPAEQAAAAARADQQPLRHALLHGRAAQATGFTSTGNFIARPLPAIGGEFPVVQAAFYAPGAPTTYWIGTRVKF